MTRLDDIQQAAERGPPGNSPVSVRHRLVVSELTRGHARKPAELVNWIQGASPDVGEVAGRVKLNDFAQALADAEGEYTDTRPLRSRIVALELIATEAAAMLAETNHGGLSHLRSVSMQAALEAARVPIPPNCSACPHPGRDKRIAELEAALGRAELVMEAADILATHAECIEETYREAKAYRQTRHLARVAGGKTNG